MDRMCPKLSIGRAALVGVFVLCVIVVCATPLRAQSEGGVELPFSSLRDITTDFDAGRNAIYCYYGRYDAVRSVTAPVIHVDSVLAVTTPLACRGLGFAFISRIDDRAFLISALRGLIDSNPDFRVVSAFYRTEIIETYGEPVRAARALSVVRGAAPAPAPRAGSSD